MGGGDLKLFVVMGLYLGVAASLFALFFSCILGLIMGAIQKRGKENKGPQIPFGPAIALAFYAMLLYGDGLVNWYMALLGRVAVEVLFQIHSRTNRDIFRETM